MTPGHIRTLITLIQLLVADRHRLVVENLALTRSRLNHGRDGGPNGRKR